MAGPSGIDRTASSDGAADQILSVFRAAILSGELPRGARLPPERDIAARYGVSGPAVREALRALAATGLVDVRHGSGSYVGADPDRLLALHLVTFLQLEDVELIDAVALLRVLNRQAVVLAASAATEEDVAALRAAVSAIDHAETLPDISLAVPGFLQALASSSHDRLLAGIARFLIHLVVRLELNSYGDRSATFWKAWVRRLQPYRYALTDAVAGHDTAAAGAAADDYHAAVTQQVADNPRLRGVHFSDGPVVQLLTRPWEDVFAPPPPAPAAARSSADSTTRLAVRRRKVADQILFALRSDIVTGAMPRGVRLPAERELAERFGVSGPTVREAIRGLCALGLVEVRHRGGAYVAPDVDRIIANSLSSLVQLEGVGVQDLIRLLRVLNSYAARLAVQRATEGEVVALRAAAELTTTADSVAEVASTVSRFLTTFAEMAHDRLLAALTEFLVKLVVDLEVSSHAQESQDFWQRWSAAAGGARLAIAERLEERDGDGLVAAVVDYHDAAAARIQTIRALREATLSGPALAIRLEKLSTHAS